MDLYLSAFTLPKGSAPSDSSRVESKGASPSATHSTSPDARVVGSRAGLAVSPPKSLAPGAKRSQRDARSPEKDAAGTVVLDSSDAAPRPTDLSDVVPRLAQKVGAAYHCVVQAVPCTEPVPEPLAGTSPRPMAFASVAGAQRPMAAGAAPEAKTNGTPSPRTVALPASVPVTTSPKYNFSMCGTQSQVLEARGALLQELPIAWKVVVKVPFSDVMGHAGSRSKSGTGSLRPDIRSKFDDIMDVSGAHLFVSYQESPGLDLGASLEVGRSVDITLVGSIEAIEFARVQVLLVLDVLHGLNAEQVEIDRKLHHVSSGRKRSVLQLIEEETQTTVYLSSPFAGVLNSQCTPGVIAKRNTVYITGQFYNTQRARDMITQLTTSKAKAIVSKSVPLMPSKIDWVLRERLEDLRMLMLDNSTYLDLPPIGSQKNQVKVYGTNHVDVERSIRTLMQLVSPYYTANVWLLPGSYDALGLSSKPDTRALASILTSISSGTGADVLFQNNRIEIAGLDKEVRNALRKLLRIPTLKHYTYEFRFQLELATEHREFISGKKNGKINKIMEHCGVRIRFEQFNDYNFLIDVLGTELDAALQGLGLLQEELPAEMSFHVPEAYHKRIIGVGGKNIQRIMKKFGVYVKFSNAEEFAALGGYVDNDDNVIARTPSKNATNLKNLKNSVMELVSPKDRDFTAESVMIPRRQQRALLGEKAAQVHEIERKTRCVVRFARREAALDTVDIFGPESQIVSAIEQLQQQVPLEAEVVLPNSFELESMLESKDLAQLQDRMLKELGISLAIGAHPPAGHGECTLGLSVTWSNVELFPMAKQMLDGLCTQFNVHTSPSVSVDAYQTSMPSFSSSLRSPPLDDASPGPFHLDGATTSGSSSGPPFGENGHPAGANTTKDLKALFEQSAGADAMAFDCSSNTPLMPSFYTPSYADGAGLSNPVWGAPLPSMPERKPQAGTGSSMFSPFSAGSMPFSFGATEPLGTESARSPPGFPSHPPIRRPEGMGSGLPSGMPHGMSQGAYPPPHMGRMPMGLHNNGGIGNDIDGFHPMSDHSSMPSLSMRSAPGSAPGHRGGGRSMPRNPPGSTAPSDTMDEVSRVLAQIAFEKQ